jgi:hypothetical protein
MIYRVDRKARQSSKPTIIEPVSTSRAPGNVTYFVDNIWEWLRPEQMPSRRKSAFASPTPELAAMGAGGSVEDAWQVKLLDSQSFAQIVRGEQPHDARYHTDNSRLKVIFKTLLGTTWYDLPAQERACEAVLFIPCATAQDVETAIRNSALLDEEAIKAVSTFWSDVELLDSDQMPAHAAGEIFFTGSYQLLPLSK